VADELTEQVLAAEQDERRRIALFLHDGPVQALSGVALMLDAALEFVQRGDREHSREVLEKAMSRTRATIGELRDLSFNIEPVVLRDQGFDTAVHALAQDRALDHGIHVELDVDAADTLGERAQAALYQIVREALDGAIRRGPPTEFSVRARPAADGTLEVEIRDNAPGERRKRSVEVLDERARTLGASLSLVADDAGSAMRLTLPSE
jgi:signal transduction histidine kinase